MMTRDEIEAGRIERLKKLDRENADDPAWREHFKPGSFGRHEALQRGLALLGMVVIRCRRLRFGPSSRGPQTGSRERRRACDGFRELHLLRKLLLETFSHGGFG